jgi:UDP-N-acetylglucosamine acyltransferase
MNEIHPSVIIDKNVNLGKSNIILPNTIIYGPAEIGDSNIVGPNVVIGTPGQNTRDRYYETEKKKIIIGSRNIIREFTAIQKPYLNEFTFIGDDVFLMQGVHIPHDAIIENNVVITPMCVLAGFTNILEGANIGMGATISQYSVVGQYSMIATGSAVMKNVKPFSRYIPNKPISVNYYAIEKFGFSSVITEIEDFVLRNIPPNTLKLKSIIERFNFIQVNSEKESY